MTIEKAFAQRIADERYRLQAQRGHMLAETVSEYALDALLAALGTAVNLGAPAPTKASLTELVELAGQLARTAADGVPSCPACGHAWAEHLGWVGCLECADCTQAPTPAPAHVIHLVGSDVTVTSKRSKYYRCSGLAIGRDGGGLLVRLPGFPDPIHFERSELRARQARRGATLPPTAGRR